MKATEGGFAEFQRALAHRDQVSVVSDSPEHYFDVLGTLKVHEPSGQEKETRYSLRVADGYGEGARVHFYYGGIESFSWVPDDNPELDGLILEIRLKHGGPV